MWARSAHRQGVGFYSVVCIAMTVGSTCAGQPHGRRSRATPATASRSDVFPIPAAPLTSNHPPRSGARARAASSRAISSSRSISVESPLRSRGRSRGHRFVLGCRGSKHPASADQDPAKEDEPDTEHDCQRDERDSWKYGDADAGDHAQQGACNDPRAISDLGMTYRNEQLDGALGDPVGAEDDREQQERQPNMAQQVDGHHQRENRNQCDQGSQPAALLRNREHEYKLIYRADQQL